MSQYVDNKYKTFTASAAIAKYALVKLATDKVATAGLAEQPIGVAMQEAFADGDKITVGLLTGPGTLPMIAAGAIVQGAVVYGRASGKVDDVSSSSAVKIGVSVQVATTADGDVVEVMPVG